MKKIIVYADWHFIPEIKEMGVLTAQSLRGEEIFSFEYSPSWLTSEMAQELDPDLKLYAGSQFINDDKSNFGLFMDSAPDRWGRMLMNRREALNARERGTEKKRLQGSDYLLGVNDASRMGALRFKLEESGNFLNDDELKVPPIARIRELQQASLRIENDDLTSDIEVKKWLNMLIAPGSSLGGARPKASVVDLKGHLWIAKFPSKNDLLNSGAWEYLVNQMAFELGINVAVAEMKTFSKNKQTYLTKRFDRTSDQKRIHYSSAMSLLGHKDGHHFKDGASYLELVELLEQIGSQATVDIRELWKRIVFSVAVSNTDDHLRNHGFLLFEDGWKLSPAFDINPTEKGVGLSLNISETENNLDFELCMEVIDFFRWKEKEAIKFIEKTKNIVGQWKSRARQLKIQNSEINQMESAFNY